MTKWTLFLAASLLSLAGCEPAPTTAPAQDIVQPVKLITVGATDQQRYREFPAVIEAAQVAQVAFRVGGEIVAFPAKQAGTLVAEGDLIAKLDPTDFQLVVDQAQARFELADAQYQRMKNLVEQGVVSPQQFDEAKANLEVSRASLETARANLRYSELRAPFAGTIASVFVEPFETVQPQKPIVTLQMDGAIDISIRVPEQLFARVQHKLDYQPEVVFSARPELTFRAAVKEWDSTADPATNTYKVVFTMPTPQDFNVLPGMSATVRVDTLEVSTRTQNGIFVPTQAIFSATTTSAASPHRVWVYNSEQERVFQREVTLGVVTESSIEVIAGLEAGEQIVVAGVHALTEQQRVRPWVKERGL